MTLFNMAFKNIRRNFNSYLIYFVSMVFSIMIFHVFTSIQYNEQIADLQEVSSRVFITFKTSSIVIAIFAGIFIWYSNSFFIKRRKKEVALYSLMGVRKKQIGRMLFYENILMGILALITGILTGSLLSKLFVMLLLRLMGFDLQVDFVIQLKPIIDTAIMFSILFLITSVHGYTIIYRFKLIDLFKAENTGQKPPKTSWIKAVMSLVLIIGGYIYYLDVKRLHALVPFITLALVVTGTYLLFSSLTVAIIRLAKKKKSHYYKGTNLISTSQLMYRLRAHARTLATIAVLSATTLTAMGVTSTFYYDFQTSLSARQPFSYVYLSDNKTMGNEVDSILAKYPENSIKNEVEFELFRADGKLPALGNYKEYRDKKIYVLSETTYNQIAAARGLKNRAYLDFQKDILFMDPYYEASMMKSYQDQELQLMLSGGLESFHIKTFQSMYFLNSNISDFMAVLEDDMYQQLRSQGEVLTGKAYNINNPRNSEALTEEISVLMETMKENNVVRFSALYHEYKEALISSGLTIFIGAFLGLIFLMATGSIIFFKQLSEANEDKKRYQVLKNVGFGKRDIKSIISKQMLFVFMLPLLVGVTHSVVAVSILKMALQIDVFIPLLVTIGAYTLIYMIYYLLTVSSYTKLIETNK